MAEEVFQWCSSAANIQCVLMEFTLRVSSSTIRMTTPRRRRMTSSARDGISSSSHSYTLVTIESCCVLQLVLSGRSDNLLLSEHHTSGEEASSPRPDARCCWDKLWEWWYYHPTFVVITISWQTRIWSWFHTMECARCWSRVPQVTTTGEAR